jgi:TatD DNase family protein
MFVDSHCHLSFDGLAERIGPVLEAMQRARVERALCICTTIEEFPKVLGLAQAHAELWATVGVHPDSEQVHEPSAEELAHLGRHPRVLAIGETGLDYYRLAGRSVDDMAWQRDRFRQHIRAAVAVGKPLVVHTRAAAGDTLAILREEGACRVGGVFHCFTETQDVAQAALDLGFHISFSGIISFRNARELREVAGRVPTAARPTNRRTWCTSPRCWPRSRACRWRPSPRPRGRTSTGSSAAPRRRRTPRRKISKPLEIKDLSPRPEKRISIS